MVVKSKSRIIGYARVSSGNQNLDTQLDRLQKHGCDKIYQEKISGMDQNRPALLSCLDYLRDGDTLVITRLDRMARSAVHLGQIAEKLKHKDVNLVVLEQNIDTTTSQGKLMFHMLGAFAEFENDLRRERQKEGIARAKNAGTKFGAPIKVTEEKALAILQDIYSNNPMSLSTMLEKHGVSQRTFYLIKNYKHPSTKNIDQKQFNQKTTRIILWLSIENNSKYVRGKTQSRQIIEDSLLSLYNAKNCGKGSWEYELTFTYTDDEDLENQINQLTSDMQFEANCRNGFIVCDFREIGTDRRW